MKTRKVWETATAVLASISMVLANLVANAQSPGITVTPKPFNGSNSLITFLDYAIYATWIFVFGLITYAAFEAREGALSPRVKKALGGAIVAAFLLFFGWSILTGVI
jgi:ABC-type Na+ efflux pump permease subunit